MYYLHSMRGVGAGTPQRPTTQHEGCGGVYAPTAQQHSMRGVGAGASAPTTLRNTYRVVPRSDFPHNHPSDTSVVPALETMKGADTYTRHL